MTGQTLLNHFYNQVQDSNPEVAIIMNDDILEVTLHALRDDVLVGQPAAERLRSWAFQLSEDQRRMLDQALSDLGYSL